MLFRSREQNPEAKQSSGPSAHSGRVRQPVWLFSVGNRFFPVACFVQQFPGLLSATKTVVSVRRRPYRQNREGLPTRPTPPAANPDPIMLLVVRLLAPSAMTDDGLVAAHRALPRQQFQRERDHPGSDLSSPSGSAIKRIKVGVKVRPFQRPAKVRSGCGPSPSGKSQCRTKKRISLSDYYRTARPNCNIGRYIGKF